MIDAPPQMPPIPDKPIAEAIVDCGIRTGSFTVTYEDELQSNVIVFSRESGASTENIECIWRATWFEFVRFADAELQAAYDAVGQDYYETHFKGQVTASARARLAERGLLATLPQRNDFQTNDDFAIALEKHCGFEPRSILWVSEDTFTVWSKTEGTPSSEWDFEKFSCLLSALTLAQEAGGNLKIGLVGNEKARKFESE